MDHKEKYELIPSDKEGLYRVKALKDFGDVKKGDIGGYVESEKNLSQFGKSWIYGSAVVRDHAQVYGYAKVSGHAKVYDDAVIYGYAKVYDDAVVYGYAKVSGHARVYDSAEISGDAQVSGDAWVYGYAKVYDDAVVYGYAEISGHARVENKGDFIVFKNWWSSGRYFTWTRSNNMWVVGCFYGTAEELVQKAYADSEISGREYERIVKYVEEILKTE